MPTAYLYIRVSTDEQAVRGYSLPFQEKKLQQYCTFHEIQVLDIIREDYSAKTFKRPAWSKLMHTLSRGMSSPVDLLLFTKWDRFSRNASEAFITIDWLKNLGVSVQAIDQPFDLATPERKIIFAVYIAISEVEHERRSLNVRQGIHEAREEGQLRSPRPPLGFSRLCPTVERRTYGSRN